MTQEEWNKKADTFLSDGESCPHCGVAIGESSASPGNSDGKYVVVDFACPHCHKDWSATYVIAEASHYDPATDEVLDYNPNNQLFRS